MQRRVLISLLAVGALAVPAAPAGAKSAPSCVGQYASTVARDDVTGGAAHGADVSFGAQFASQPNFGAGVVAPYAHLPRDVC